MIRKALALCLLFLVGCAVACMDELGAVEPKPSAEKPTLQRMYVLRTPQGWMLTIHNDGSAQLTFGAALGDQVPAETFKLAEVRKSLDRLQLDSKGRLNSHFVVWYEEERQAADNGPPPRYTRDEKSIVPLFEQAAAALSESASARLLKQLGKKLPGFGLKD